MGLWSKLFRSSEKTKKNPSKQEVEVYFAYGSTNFQHVYAFEEQLLTAVSDTKVGEFSGHELAADGSDGRLFLYGPDAEAIFRVISPVLTASPLMRGATVTLRFNPSRWGSRKRVIQLP